MPLKQMKKRAKNFARLLDAHLKHFPNPTSSTASLEFMAQLDGYPNWHAAVSRRNANVLPGIENAPQPLVLEQKVRFTSARYCASHLVMWNKALNQHSGMIVVGGITGSGIDMTVQDICVALSAGHRGIHVVGNDPERWHNDLYVDAPHVMEEPRSAAAAKHLLKTVQIGRQALFPLHTDGIHHITPRLEHFGLQLADLSSLGVLNLLVNQRYLRRLCPHCSQSTDLALKEHQQGELCSVSKACEFVSEVLKRPIEGLLWRNKNGCEQCNMFRNVRDWPKDNDVDSVLVTEMFSPDERWRELIAGGNHRQAFEYFRSLSDGDVMSGDMRGKTKFDQALKLALEGQIDIRECIEVGSFDHYS